MKRAVLPGEMTRQEAYRLLTSIIVPRPIALVATRMGNGKTNIAPFSFFNGVASKPPSIAFSIGPGEHGEKDTIHNLRAHPEFVVHVVTEALLPVVKVGEMTFPRDVSEAEVAEAALVPSQVVAVPTLAAAQVAMECRLIERVELGPAAERTHHCIGEILAFTLDERFFGGAAGPEVDAVDLAAVARIDRGGFARFGARFRV